MRVLVTGGAGYIGSVVVDRLIDEGATVIVLDDLSQGHRAAIHPAAEFVEATLSDRAALAEAFTRHQPQTVMHFAAHAHVGESMERPFLYLGENVLNGVALFETAIKHGVRRFVFSSTANLFSSPQQVPITEDEVVSPGSPYGESKWILERMLHWMEQVHGARFAVLRYFNAAGATQARGEDHTPERRLIPLVLDVAAGRRESITILGDDYPTPDGTCIRDFVHVSDIAAAHVLVMQALDHGSHTFHIGSGTGNSVREVITLAGEVTGREIPTIIGERRPGDPAILVASSSRIRAELGWQPRYDDLRGIIATAWAWRESHPHGYSDA